MTIQLRYSDEFRCYVLSNSELNTDDNSFEMVIDRGWDGERWYRYKFITWIDGEWYEACTKAEYDERVTAIAENEGDEAANIWKLHQNQVMVIRTNHQVFDLRKRWDAMMELKLFDLSVNSWGMPSKPLNAECVDKMAEYRDRWQRKEADNTPDSYPDGFIKDNGSIHHSDINIGEVENFPDHGDWAEARASGRKAEMDDNPGE